MKEVWSETSIHAEFAKLDKRTGLKGAELPISFNNARCTFGLYDSTDGESFKFSNYYFQNPDCPIESALDVIRHEYAHHDGVCRCVIVRFKNSDCKMLELGWVDRNCHHTSCLSN